MSISTLPAAANAALASTMTQVHGHGHKRGLQQLDSLSARGSTSAGQTPTGSTQELFSNLLSSLGQVGATRVPQLGQTPKPAPTAPASPIALAAAGSKLNVTA